ncbi:hypothetical protein V5799_012478 [Amblyomma americanum]|uniref:8.9 kDa family member n=1 Tax=Amblyomma americanum TaxID=6943 RepID=A0AAQ4EEC6_AMBAM
MCLYKSFSIPTLWVSSTHCVNLTCDKKEKTVKGYMCLEKNHPTLRDCKEVSGGIKQGSGFFPYCCPDYVCPDKTVQHGKFVQKTEKATSVTKDVCKYRGRYFRGNDSEPNVCERWICYPERQEVDVFRPFN